ncbi:hemerythrin domain-containing protein [Nocardioides sp. DS6]|uniref:Hemerythrin domain-containing protein n=1 Tax=Nocardioides eburneus TaxID=3231482 RepID=A0ABV3T4Z2_9ACTN
MTATRKDARGSRSRAEILRLVAAKVSYDEIGRRLGIAPGLAYLIATGLPADGSDAPTADAHEWPGFLGSSQHLANPEPAENTTSREAVRRWVHARVEADAAMREAAARRDAVPPEQPFGDVEPDVVDVLVRDHNQVTAMLKQLATIPGAQKGGTPAQRSARASIVDLVTVALSRHEAAEEQALWPAVRQVLPAGDALADEALAQEQHGKEILQALAHLDGTAEEDGERFDDLVEELSAACRTHVAFEEKVFLQLREQMPRSDRVDLARTLDRARRHGPTRPHPHAPSEPPAVDVAGALGTAMDRMRDVAGSRPADRRGRPSADAERRTEQGAEQATESEDGD